ncbi:MAG: hypothetical protein ACOCWQ_04935 [Nanoarchaeota archaeon]
MEFNPDGSLKVDKSEKDQEVRATVTISPMPGQPNGAVMTIAIQDTKIPYNLVEGQFHNVNANHEIDCQARLGKKTEALYDITIHGNETEKWIDVFCKEFSDYLNDAIEIQRS